MYKKYIVIFKNKCELKICIYAFSYCLTERKSFCFESFIFSFLVEELL